MNWINKAFERADIQQIRSFILDSCELSDIDKLSYEDRGAAGEVAIQNRLKALCTDAEDYDDAIDDLNHALNTYMAIYTEIGMKLGARLMCEIFCKNEL